MTSAAPTPPVAAPAPAPEPANLLVVDDDVRLRELLRRYLTERGFRVTTAANAVDARRQLALVAPDLIVLDVMMPGEDGVALTRDLRQEGAIPILLLTARGDPEHRIAGLEAGADDYLAKPFEPRELLLRIAAILRRAPPAPPETPGVRLGRWTYVPGRPELRAGEEVQRLTEVEARLMEALAAEPGVVVPREALVALAGREVNTRTIDVQVTRLRRKFERDPRRPRFLHTVRGRGYVLKPD